MTGVAQERLERLLRLVLGQRLASRTTLIKFALVGGTGYVVYQSVLFLMYDSPLIWFLPAKNTSADLLVFEHGDLRFLITTLVATSLALVGVFTGHNLWTFGAKPSDRKPLWLRFGQFAAFASVAAFGIVLPTVNVLTVQFDLYHFLALPVGVALGGVWDWLWYSRFVWRDSRAEQADAHGG